MPGPIATVYVSLESSCRRLSDGGHKLIRGKRHQRTTSGLVASHPKNACAIDATSPARPIVTTTAVLAWPVSETRNAFSGRTALLPTVRRFRLAETCPSITGSEHCLSRAGLVVLCIIRWLVWYTTGRDCVCPGPGSIAAREPLGRSRCSSTVGKLSTTTVRCWTCPRDSPDFLRSGSSLSACLACWLAGARASAG